MKGSCLCGRITYAIEGTPLGINYCHCRQCRKASGSAFATTLAVPTGGFAILAGREALKSHRASAGKTRYFCGECGSPIYALHDDAAETTYVRLGTLDDDPGIRPQVHIHVASKAPWHEIRDDLPRRDEEEDLWF